VLVEDAAYITQSTQLSAVNWHHFVGNDRVDSISLSIWTIWPSISASNLSSRPWPRQLNQTPFGICHEPNEKRQWITYQTRRNKLLISTAGWRFTFYEITLVSLYSIWFTGRERLADTRKRESRWCVTTNDVIPVTNVTVYYRCVTRLDSVTADSGWPGDVRDIVKDKEDWSLRPRQTITRPFICFTFRTSQRLARSPIGSNAP